jgi:regulatory protein
MARLEITRDEPSGSKHERARPVGLRLGGRPWLRVSVAELLELDLREGEEIDASRLIAVERELARTRARLYVVRSLTARAQSVAEIRAKLARRSIPADLAEEAIELALGYGYLDDEALAAQLARGQRSKGLGRRRAERMLHTRGLPVDLATAALEAAYGVGDETEQARAALGRRTFGDGEAGRRRAAAFLARRGFSSGAAWAAVRARETGDP